MSRNITIKDVAQLAGVSVGTASRVLNGNSATSARSRAAVTEAARRLDFQPNGLASSLRSTQTRSVGLLVSDIRNPFFSELAFVIQTALFELGYCTMVGNASERGDLQDQFLTALRRQRVAGLICVPQGDGDSVLPRMAADGLPIVFVDRTLPITGVPSVNSDPVPGIGEALQRFKDDGHERVAFIAGPQNSSTGLERLQVFQSLASGRFAEARVAEGGYEPDACAASVRRVLADGCTALLFGYSPNAITGLRVVSELGLRVPDDLSLVSFDEIPFFEFVTPAVSVIHQGITEMGQEAVSMLAAIWAGAKPSDRRLPSRLVVRATNGRVPASTERASR